MRVLSTLVIVVIGIIDLGCKETQEERNRRKAEAAAEYEKLGAKAAAVDTSAKARAQRVYEDRKDRERFEAEQSRKTAEEAERQAAQRREAQIQAYREAGPEGRERALRDGQPSGLISAAAADDKERSHLVKVLEELDAKAAAAASVAEVRRRDDFASAYDKSLLARHLNPDGVDATGTGKKTLSVSGWFCTRQYVYDFSGGPDGAAARAAGFTKVHCANSLADTWDLDL